MMIQAVLGNPHHPEYGVATIPFPIPRDQHAHCMELLEALEIGDAVKADCKVEKIDSFYTVLKRVEMLTVNEYHITDNHLEDNRFIIEGEHRKCEEISESLRRRFIENGMPLGELAQFVQGKEEDE